MTAPVDLRPPPPASSLPAAEAPWSAPRWVRLLVIGFHLGLVGLLGCVLVVVSAPGGGSLLAVAALVAVAYAGALWFGAGIIQLVLRRSGRRVARSRWFLVAPVLVVATVGLLASGVSLDVRWSASREAFEGVADQARPGVAPDQRRPLDHDGRVGLYSVSQAYQQGDAVIVYSGTAGIFDDAGFAYLPSGPFPELETGSFESPTFEPIGDGWYTWTASW